MNVLSIANVPEYPKIETLYERDEKTFKVIPGRIRCPEFALIDQWDIYEKIDGTNIRIAYVPTGEGSHHPQLFIGGRTNDAQIPPHLLQYLTAEFSLDRLLKWVRHDCTETVTIYGEGYGAKIQKGGGNYRATPGFRAFDIRVGDTWLDRDGFNDACAAMTIPTAPIILEGVGILTAKERLREHSRTAQEDGVPGCQHEGIIARTFPTLLTRLGKRIMWKLKTKDFQ